MADEADDLLRLDGQIDRPQCEAGAKTAGELVDFQNRCRTFRVAMKLLRHETILSLTSHKPGYMVALPGSSMQRSGGPKDHAVHAHCKSGRRPLLRGTDFKPALQSGATAGGMT
jgi:hypothetical protein